MICSRSSLLSPPVAWSSITEPIRLLCIDDDPTFLRLLQAGLEARGFEVISAFPGIDAFMQQKGSAGQFYAVVTRLKPQSVLPDSVGDPPAGSSMRWNSSIKGFAAAPGSLATNRE
jgi:hypothetical protein